MELLRGNLLLDRESRSKWRLIFLNEGRRDSGDCRCSGGRLKQWFDGKHQINFTKRRPKFPPFWGHFHSYNPSFFLGQKH